MPWVGKHKDRQLFKGNPCTACSYMPCRGLGERSVWEEEEQQQSSNSTPARNTNCAEAQAHDTTHVLCKRMHMPVHVGVSLTILRETWRGFKMFGALAWRCVHRDTQTCEAAYSAGMREL